LVSALRATEISEEKSVAAKDWAPLLKASLAVARLDERLSSAPSPVLEGWTRRALIHEATSSLRLDGFYVTAQDLMLALHDSLDRAGDPDLGRAIGIHQMLQALMRRNAKNLFQPRRLMALARPRLRSGPAEAQSQMPHWLRERMPDPAVTRTAVEDALDPAAVAGWTPLPALAGSAALIARWHDSGAAASIGGAGGRALAMAWAQRAGLSSGYRLMLSIGFLGRAYDYRPDSSNWTAKFLDACTESAAWGVKLEGHLKGTYRRLHEAAPRERSSSRIASLVDLLICRPLVSAKDAALALGVTPHAGRAMLGELERRGLVREATGRSSYRVYAATAF
jgi:HTH DNA binding domain